VLQKGFGFGLSGGAGTGKTMFLSMTLAKMARRRYSVFYTTAPELDDHLRAGLADRDVRRLLDKRLTSHFVAIDDLGREPENRRSEEFGGRLRQLYTARRRDGFPTLFGTRLDDQELVERYPGLFEEAALDTLLVTRMEAGDYRRVSRGELIDHFSARGDE
jgi:DNA replication protein DnaC